jgi:hypothetical protein
MAYDWKVWCSTVSYEELPLCNHSSLDFNNIKTNMFLNERNSGIWRHLWQPLTLSHWGLSFLRWACNAMNFPPSTAIVAS